MATNQTCTPDMYETARTMAGYALRTVVAVSDVFDEFMPDRDTAETAKRALMSRILALFESDIETFLLCELIKADPEDPRGELVTMLEQLDLV